MSEGILIGSGPRSRGQTQPVAILLSLEHLVAHGRLLFSQRVDVVGIQLRIKPLDVFTPVFVVGLTSG